MPEMPVNATWQGRFADSGARVTAGLSAAFAYLARPDVFPLFRRVIGALLVLWILLSVWTGTWSFLPEAEPLPSVTVINPVTESSAGNRPEVVDIEQLVAAQFFGEPGAEIVPADLASAGGRSPAMTEEEAAESLAGIEDGAPETRLPLVLRGVVASTEAGLGQAVIEHRNTQDLYQVSDELPVNGKVTLAKVMPTLVVLDNGGRYELLRLFEQTRLSRQAESIAGSRARRQQVEAATAQAATDQDEDDVSEQGPAMNAAPSELAARYRDQLYSDPESLADVVRVTAVRQEGSLRGYRLRPGKAAAEFSALGFKTGDIVTAVNGLSLADPANTVRLYQTMRSAQAASFELEREGDVVTLDVSIGEGGG